MKSYRFFGEEAEVLGRRLDFARDSLAIAKSEWAKSYWTSVVDRLLLQWRQLPVLHDGDAQTTIIPRWTIDYEYYERGQLNEGNGITDRAYYKLFKNDADLTASWEAHREARLARAQF